MTGDSGTGIAYPDDIRLAWQPMTAEQAEAATALVNAHAVRLPQCVKDAKDGEAYRALGFASWAEYVDARLVISVQYANALVRCAEKNLLVAQAIDVDVDALVIPERVSRSLSPETMVSAATEAVAELEDGADEAAKIAAATAATKDAVKKQQAASEAVTAAQRRRCVEHLTADPTLSVREMAKAAGAPVEMAQDVWDELAPVREAHEAELAKPLEQRMDEAMARQQEAAKTSDGEAPAPPAARPSPGNDPAPAVDPATGKPDEPHAVEAPGSAEGGTSDGAGASGGEPTSTAPPALPDDWAKRLADATYLLSIDPESVAVHASGDDLADLTELAGWLARLDQAKEHTA